MIRFWSLLLFAIIFTMPKAIAATCYGSANCRACSSCRYCGHCNSGGTCGVCSSVKFQAPRHPKSVPPTFKHIKKTSSPSRRVRTRPKGKIHSKPDPVKAVPSHMQTAYVQRVRARVQESWNTYEPHNKVTARIYFEITKAGQPTQIKVLSSVGSSDEVQNAREAIKYATPFGVPPIKEGNMRIVVDFRNNSLSAASTNQTSEQTLVDKMPPLAPSINQHSKPKHTYRNHSYPIDYYTSNGNSSFTNNSSGGLIQVRGYYRKDGTYVKPHTRRRHK